MFKVQSKRLLAYQPTPVPRRLAFLPFHQPWSSSSGLLRWGRITGRGKLASDYCIAHYNPASDSRHD